MHFISLVDVSNIWTNCIFHWKLPLVIITIHMETCCSVFGMITCWLCTWAEFTLTKRRSWAWQCPAKVQAAQCVMVTQHRWWCWLRVKFSLSTYSSQCSMCSLESSEVCGMIYITVWQCFWRWRTGNGGLECVNSRLVAASVQMILPCSQLWVCVHHLLEDVCESVPAITLKKKNASKKLSSEQQMRYSTLVLTDFCSLCGSPMECTSEFTPCQLLLIVLGIHWVGTLWLSGRQKPLKI